MNRAANYCPSCGAPVATARTIPLDEDVPVTGTFANPDESDAHVIVDESVIEIYVHEGGDF
jgi:hypothetical protein